MNNPSILGYPGLVGQHPGQRAGTPTTLNPQLHTPPGLMNNEHSIQLLQQLNGNSNGTLMMGNAHVSMNDMGAAGQIGGSNGGNPTGNSVNNADNTMNSPLYHPHLEDISLLNSPIWKLQLQLASVAMQTVGQPNVYARQNAMKKYLVSQQQQQQNQQQQNPQLNEAAMSLVDRTKQLLMDMATDSNTLGSDSNSLDNKSSSQSNNTNATNSTISTPTTPKTELNQLSGTPTNSSMLLQHKKLSQYNIDEDDEIEQQNRIMNPNDTKYDEQLWHAIDLSNLQLFNVNKNLFKYTFLTRLYLNGNNLSQVPKEIKHLSNLRVLDLSHNNITELPKELGFCYQLKYLYLFNNMIKNFPWEFGNLSNLQFLGCEGNPLDRQLLKILLEKSVTGLIFYLRDNRPEIPLIKERRFIDINTDGEVQDEYNSLEEYNKHINKEVAKKSFSVLSYNTLCQHYATPKMYRYTQSWALSWEYRREKLTEQILSFNSDVICLQEVESKSFEEYWVPLLQKHGYVGTFYAKTRAKTMQTKDSKKVDGCCVFYKESEFKLIYKDSVDFSGVWMKHKKFQRTEDYLNRAMNKDNVALYLKLEHIKTGETLWVVTTHLHWDPQFNDVKTFQVGVLLDHLEELLKEHNSASTKQDIRMCPVIICGDLNSHLDSAVYELLSTGHVQVHKDIEDRFYGYMSQKNFAHNLALRSSYNCIGELPFTNFTPSFTNVIDYIWFSTQALRVRGVLGPVDQDYVSNFIGFPNNKFPSDHIPLLARYEFTKGVGGSRKV